MGELRVDLHCHSTYSDGSLTPSQLLALAKQEELDAIAITDHDTFEGFFEAAKERSTYCIEVLPGIEISAEHGKESVHVLGLAFDPSCEQLSQFCIEQRKKRLGRNRAIIQKISSLGMPLTEDDIMTSTNPGCTYGRVHIAHAMWKKGYVKDIAHAFRRYIGDSKSCYVSAEHCSVEQAIAIIHEAKGKAVLAHPHLIVRKSTLRAMMQLPFDGIEGIYSRFPSEDNLRWIQTAREKGWFVTGGSDFHGVAKPQTRLGCSLTSEEVFLQLKHHFYSVAPSYAL